MSYQERPAETEFAEYYRKYVRLVPDGDIVAILATQIEDTLALVRDLTEQQALHAYAPGKWTVKQVIGHIIDAERVFSYRMMRFARRDTTPLASFDENEYAANAMSDARPLASLIAELSAVRRSTVALLAGLPADAWTRSGPASGYQASVRAIAWITAGHELHHREILSSRYLNTEPDLSA